jgi:hypothetical protein
MKKDVRAEGRETLACRAHKIERVALAEKVSTVCRDARRRSSKASPLARKREFYDDRSVCHHRIAPLNGP